MQPTSAKYHKTLAGYFLVKPLYLDEPDHEKPYTRKLVEQPWQYTKMEMWNELMAILCNLLFVEAKCKNGLIFNLISDYEFAYKNLPEAQTEKSEKTRRAELVNRWIATIIEYAHKWNDRHDREALGETVTESEPFFPEIILSIEPLRDEQIDTGCKRIIENPTRFDRLSSYGRFVKEECLALLKFGQRPGFVIQHAFNYAPTGPVHIDAEKKVSSVEVPMLLRQWHQNFVYNPQHVILQTLEGHSLAVRSVSITPDGQRAVSGAGNVLRVWDFEKGQCLHTLEGHTDFVNAVSISPDGLWAVSGSCDRTLRFWSLESGKCLQVLNGHTLPVNAISITPDGRRVLSGTKALSGTPNEMKNERSFSLLFWDIRKGECIKILKGHTDNVNSISMSIDGCMAISGSDDHTIRMWDLESGQCLHILECNMDCVNAVSMTPDGYWAVSADYNIIRLWDLKKGEFVKRLHWTSGNSSFVSISPDGHLVISGGSYGLIIWNFKSGECLRHLQESNISSNCFSVTPDGQRAVSGNMDTTISVWDLIKGRSSILTKHEGLTSVAITPNGHKAVSVGNDRYIRVWNVEKGECLKKIDKKERHSFPVVSITYDGNQAVYGGSNGLQVWDLNKGTRIHLLMKLGWCKRVSIIPDSLTAVSGSDDGIIRLWDLTTGECLRMIKHYPHVFAFDTTRNGRCLVSDIFSKTIEVWDLKKGKCLQVLVGHTKGVFSLSVTGDGKKAVSVSDDGTLRLWDLKNGSCLRVFQDLFRHLSQVRMTADRKWAIYCGNDNTLRLLNIMNGECVALLALKSPICSLSDLLTNGIVVAGTTADELIFIKLYFPLQQLSDQIFSEEPSYDRSISWISRFKNLIKFYLNLST